MTHNANWSALPPELTRHITNRLALGSRTSLRAASPALGSFSTDELLRGIKISLDDSLGLDSQTSSRLSRMSRLTHVHLVASGRHRKCKIEGGLTGALVGLLAPSVAAAAAETPEEAHAGLLAQQQQQQQAALLTARLVLLPALTTLTLNGLHISSAAAAVAYLSSSSPTKASPALTKVTLDSLQLLPAPPKSGGWDEMWAALAGATALRKLVVKQQGWESSHLQGLTRVTQLHSLTVEGTTTAWNNGFGQDVSLAVHPLKKLTQLHVEMRTSLRVALGADEQDTPCGLLALVALPNLQSLHLSQAPTDDWVRGRLAMETANMTTLTRLELPSFSHDDVAAAQLVTAQLKAWLGWRAHLRELDLSAAQVAATDLVCLPRLTHLVCADFMIPAAGPAIAAAATGGGGGAAAGAASSSSVLPSLRLLTCRRMIPTDDGADWRTQAPLPLGVLCPALEALDVWPSPSVGPEFNRWVAQVFSPEEPFRHLAAPLRALTSVKYTYSGARPTLQAMLADAAAVQALEKLELVCLKRAPLDAFFLPSVAEVGEQLRTLKVSVGSDIEIGWLRAACPSLTELHLSGTKKRCLVTDYGIADLAQHVRDVTVRNCLLITRRGIAALAANRSVQRIAVVGCRYISQADVRDIPVAVGRPWLDIDVVGGAATSATAGDGEAVADAEQKEEVDSDGASSEWDVEDEEESVGEGEEGESEEDEGKQALMEEGGSEMGEDEQGVIEEGEEEGEGEEGEEGGDEEDG